MKVFISWSGERSRKTAEIISKWLERNIQALETWMSTDIKKGKRWSPELYKQLEETRIGIICLNKDNLDSNWIMFEAGAIAKLASSSHACTFLLDLAPKDIEPPLSDFQHTIFAKEDLRKLLYTINSLVKEAAEKYLEKDKLDEMFDMLWDKLNKELTDISKSSKEEAKPTRSNESILEEILNLNRSMDLKMANNQLFLARLINVYSGHGQLGLLNMDVMPEGGTWRSVSTPANATGMSDSPGFLGGTYNSQLPPAITPEDVARNRSKSKKDDI